MAHFLELASFKFVCVPTVLNDILLTHIGQYSGQAMCYVDGTLPLGGVRDTFPVTRGNQPRPSFLERHRVPSVGRLVRTALPGLLIWAVYREDGAQSLPSSSADVRVGIITHSMLLL